ncbi:MAG: hypothetical protein NZM37_09970 [Sandaracinaceae bacterium]|nr:hypothetical protein [Sandaracinaceae bacterium]
MTHHPKFSAFHPYQRTTWHDHPRGKLLFLSLIESTCFVLFALVGSQGTRAQSRLDPELESVREMILHASYRPALMELQRYLERQDVGAFQRNAALELLATVQLALRDEVSARRTLAQLFSRDPEHRLVEPDASPVVLSAVARARAQARPLRVILKHHSPALSKRQAPLITVEIEEGHDAVAEIRVQHRVQGQTQTETVVLRNTGAKSAEGRLPIAEGKEAYVAEYWIEAVAPSGFVLSRLGSESEPFRVEIPEEKVEVRVETRTEVVQVQKSTDITQEAWFWVLLGVASAGAAGAAIGIGVAASQGPTDGSLGTITLPIASF